MNPIAIQCANCGAKYKLPETFAGDKAKCKACGSSIDVKAARSGAAAPAAAAPAPAKPARSAAPAARPAPAEPKEESAAPRASARASSSRRGKDEGGGSARASRSGRGAARGGDGEGKKKEGKGLLVGGLIGGVAILGVVAWLLLGGKKDAAGTGENAGTTANANATEDAAKKAADEKAAADKTAADKAAAEKAAADKDAADKAAAEKAKLAEDAKKKAEGDKPADATAKTDENKPTTDKTGEKPADANASKAEAAGDKPKFKKKGLTSKDQVYDPKKELKPLDYEEGTSDDLKKELEDLVETAATGGASAKNKAKTKLAAAGHPAMTAIVNKLRDLDYFDSDQCMTAFELNKLLESMTLGVNAQFIPVNLGDTIELDLADFNARTVGEWQKFMTQTAPTKERLEQILKARKTRNTDEGKKKDEGSGEEIK